MKKILKIAGLILLFLIVIMLLVAAFAGKEYSVEREVTMNSPKQVVFDFAKYLKNQNKYSVWAKIDPNMKTEFRGTDGTVGFVSGWDSENKNAGRGEQEITGIEEGTRIDYELRFYEPMKSTDKAFMSFESVNDSVTSVRWGIYGKIKYPMNLSLLFMDMDAMLGKDLEGGLKNLKLILEK
ncbi:MAG TPA: polyketide cyclase [Bacteroidales bacterium]|nr:polyketide cyclase [Bacteroidales bacterium]HBZ19945.1 polyketide cyclase [Bacteroidales bacterium]